MCGSLLSHLYVIWDLLHFFEHSYVISDLTVALQTIKYLYCFFQMYLLFTVQSMKYLHWFLKEEIYIIYIALNFLLT